MGESQKTKYITIFGILAVFLLIAAILFAERAGIQIKEKEEKISYLDPEKVVYIEDAMSGMKKECLILTDLGRNDSADAYTEFDRMLLDMKVPNDVIDLGSEKMPEDLSGYSSVILLTPDADALGSDIERLSDWVSGGGNLLIAMTLEFSPSSEFLLEKAGAVYFGPYIVVRDLWVDKNFMLGGGQSFPIPDPFDSSRMVQLREDAEIYARANGENGVPIIWSRDFKDGKIVTVNLGLYEKSTRGFYAMAYSLLDDVCAYPVLNGLVVFLDDMPSPVPEGESQYIERDYHMSIADFYVNKWFPDIENLSKKYNFPLVGLIIENYGKDVFGNTARQPDTARFLYFGNQILRSGGELGYHGYNHQPLTTTIDYGDLFNYTAWENDGAIAASFGELMDFSEMLYPDANISVYVPPSNIMTEEGREYIGSIFPKVRTVSGTYFEDAAYDYSYTTEFFAARDGVVELPRISSGSVPDDFMGMAILSELNMHMAFSHFIHPDDAMDVDRGAELGWPTLYKNLNTLFDYVTESAPAMRHVDASTLACTVQRWSGLTVDKKWSKSGNKEVLTVTLGNYIDEAYLMMRFNTGAPDGVSGGKLTKMTETLYLLEAEGAVVTFEWNR